MTTLKSFHETNIGEAFLFYRYPQRVFVKTGYDTARDKETGIMIAIAPSAHVSVLEDL